MSMGRMAWESQPEFQHDWQHWHQRATENSWPSREEVVEVCGPEYAMYAFEPRLGVWPRIVYP